MPHPTQNALKLPRRLLSELGIQDGASGGSQGKRGRPAAHRERRKAARVQKRVKTTRPMVRGANRTKVDRQIPQHSDNSDESEDDSDPLPSNLVAVVQKGPKSILKATKPVLDVMQDRETKEVEAGPHVSRTTREKLAADDAEIDALEKALGIKGKKSLPKAFENDGLEDLLNGVDYLVNGDDSDPKKRKRSEEQEWLANKRKQRHLHDQRDPEKSRSGESDGADSILSDEENSPSSPPDIDKDSDEGNNSDDIEDFHDENTIASSKPAKVRENPYVAPIVNAKVLSAGKYVPPSARTSEQADGVDMKQLRRQVQGLLNRLSEANIVGILGDVEKLYQKCSRHDVSSTLIDLLMTLVSDPAILQDTFIILHAGLVAGVYRLIGTDFGAQMIQSAVEEFDKDYKEQMKEGSNDKKLTNLVSLFAELYNFQVVGSELIYDLIRIFLGDLSELNVELLLKAIRNSGQQLRQDDPSALKDIVLLLPPAIAKIGAQNISIRTKFMIETINNLKNNRMKTGLAASSITSEHTARMKKTLGSLHTRNLKATEPLRIGLKDIRDTHKRGKWWLVGASWKDEEEGLNDVLRPEHQHSVMSIRSDDLLQLAKQHGMNTDIRRSIFVTIMSANDYRDAHLHLLKLRLKKSQELEIPKVIIHCAGAEQVYNQFYTLIARLLCSDRKLKMAFQFSLWDIFKRLGEGEVEGADSEDDIDSLDNRAIVNLAKMFGSLVADGGLAIGILKNLNLGYMQHKTKLFVELFLVTVIIQSQQKTPNHRNDTALLDIFLKVEDFPEMTNGLQYFLRKVVSRTDVARNKQDRGTIKWGCKLVSTSLSDISTSRLGEE